jgi:alanine racemase
VCQAAGVDWLGVACASEGVELRGAGITLPILIFGVTNGAEISAAVENDLTMTVNDLTNAAEINAAAKRLSRIADIHIKADTGMARLGFVAGDGDTVSRILSLGGFGNISIGGIYTHLAESDSADLTFAREQLSRFNALLETLRGEGFAPPLVHIANSGCLISDELRGLTADKTLVRSGIALYGLSPSSDRAGADKMARLGFKPVMTLKSRVVGVRDVERGQSVGYSRNYVAAERTTIATLSIGYADGYSRLLSNRGEVLINGKRRKIAGNVCMDLTMVEADDGVKIGDEAVLIGEQGKENITFEETATLRQTITYEVLTGLSKRIEMFYSE